ncbi:MAG: DUF1570 domain-containing protein [Pirellulales bacterium]|nr:DUF1570 domain-containing protein [Pirellulales bacterium]
MRIIRAACVAGIVIIVAAAGVASAAGPGGIEGMVEVTIRGQKVEGMPIAWNAAQIHLLGRDGRLWSFAPGEATDFRQTSDRFRPYSVSEIRGMLLRELGHGYRVTGTTHYMVAHPVGQQTQWAERFEELYRGFVRYFSVRGFRLEQPPFPLIGIVCRDRADFDRQAARSGSSVGQNVLGYYSLDSNRILLYDIGGGKGSAADWRQTADTVIHEATHQTAFNTGIHSRFSPPPDWVAEGLATLFEARGVYDSSKFMSRQDQINRGRLDNYRLLIERPKRPDLPQKLVFSDLLFRAQPSVAYAESWALAYYLVQTQPHKFARYLAVTASHPPFEPVSPAQRTHDFTSIFGSNWKLFEAQFTRYMNGVK